VQKFGISVFLKTKQTNSDHPDNHQAFFYQRRTQLNSNSINLEKKPWQIRIRIKLSLRLRLRHRLKDRIEETKGSSGTLDWQSKKVTPQTQLAKR
jgi:hypothetical protein